MRFVRFVPLLLVLTGCAHQKTEYSINTESQNLLRTKVIADLALQTQDYDLALPYLIEKARRYKDAQSARLAVRLAEQRDDWISSLQAARLWAEIEPQSHLAHSMIVLGLVRSGQRDALPDALVKLWSASRTAGFPRFIQSVLQLANQGYSTPILEGLQKIQPSSDAFVASRIAAMEIMRRNGQKDSAEQIFTYLTKHYPSHPAVLLEKSYRADNHITAGRLLLNAFHTNPDVLTLGIEACRHFLQVTPTDWIQFCNSQIQAERVCRINFRVAENCLEEMMAKAPNNQELLIMAASLAFDRKNYEKAEHYVLRVLDQAPQHQLARWLLAQIYRQIGDKNLKRFAISLYDSVGAPSLVQSARIEAAEMLAEDGFYQQAIARLRSVKDNNIETQRALATAAAQILSKSPEGAQYREILRDEWEKQPEDTFLFLVELSIAEHERLPQIWQRYPGLMSEKSESLRDVVLDSLIKRNAYFAVAEFTRQALEKYPDNATYQYEHAIAQFKLRQYKSAEHELRKLVEAYPGDDTYLNALGYLLAHTNQKLDEAKKLLSKAKALNPNGTHILDSLGWLYFRLRDYDKAEALLKKVQDKDPNPIVEAHLAAVYWMTGRHKQAAKLFQKAYQAQPDDPILREIILGLAPQLLETFAKQ